MQQNCHIHKKTLKTKKNLKMIEMCFFFSNKAGLSKSANLNHVCPKNSVEKHLVAFDALFQTLFHRLPSKIDGCVNWGLNPRAQKLEFFCGFFPRFVSLDKISEYHWVEFCMMNPSPSAWEAR